MFAGKIALVTGAGSGIGRALAVALDAGGAKLALADRNATGLAETAALLSGAASQHICDLAEPLAPSALIEAVYASHGGLDLLCSNAGIGRNRRLLREKLDASAESLFAINSFAALRLLQAWLPLLPEGARARCLITASENALSLPSAVRGAGLGLYAASKHALLIMAEWLKSETEGVPLDLHVLLPGAVYTPLIAAAIPDRQKADPALNLISPERCAELALRGMELGLFYIPTQAHLWQDMQVRQEGIKASLTALGLL